MQQVEHKEAVEPSTHLQWILPVRLGTQTRLSVNIEVKVLLNIPCSRDKCHG